MDVPFILCSFDLQSAHRQRPPIRKSGAILGNCFDRLNLIRLITVSLFTLTCSFLLGTIGLRTVLIAFRPCLYG
jgi:hypothetical protein